MSYKPRPDYDEPITDVCIVSNPNTVPPGFNIRRFTHDTHDDCNLWTEGFFGGSRTNRYLCISRKIQAKFWSDSDRVLVDILVNSEKDIPPTGFTMIHHTHDTGEKATKRRVICMKMKPRRTENIAICDVIMVTSLRSIPRTYSVKGEINGKTMCVKLISVLPSPLPLEKLPSPLHQQPQKQALPPVQKLSLQTRFNPPHPSTSQYDPYRQPATRTSVGSSIYPTGHVSPTDDYKPLYLSDSPFQRFSIIRESPLKGVPFVLDEAFLELEKACKVEGVEVSYRSPVDLDNEYSYSFENEEAVVSRSLPQRNS